MNSPSLNSKAPANSASQGGEGGRKKGKWAQTTIIKHVALQFFIPTSHPHFINKCNELTFDSKKILSGFQSWTAIKAIAKWQRE